MNDKELIVTALDIGGDKFSDISAVTAEAKRLQAECLALLSERDQLRAEVEALRHLAGELYQVLGALDAPAGVLDAVLAAAHGESMEGRGSLLPFVSEEHEALRKDAERHRFMRYADLDAMRVAHWPEGEVPTGAEYDAAIDAAMAAREGDAQ